MERSKAQNKRGLLIDLAISFCALTALAASVYWGFSLRADTFAASDLKTVYASAWCFAHRQNAFSIANLQAVFAANGVMPAPSWFGRAPVYPPVTLMLLMPFVWLPMIPALYTGLAINILLLSLALTALLRYAAREFGLGLGWRALMVALFAAGPLLGFALAMGNLSVPAASFAILAYVLRKRVNPWVSGTLLALAVVLKPHLTIWFLSAMLFMPQKRSRKTAMLAVVVLCAVTAITSAWMFCTGTLMLQLHGYLGILHAETSGAGSMSAASREILPVISQITSLHTILEFLMKSSRLAGWFGYALLLACSVVLFGQTRKVATEAGSLLALGTWCALGMLVTYHRTHDAILLLVLLPWFCVAFRNGRSGWPAWLAGLFYLGLSVGPGLDTLTYWSKEGALTGIKAFVLLRQAGLADVCLSLLLLLALVSQNRRDAKDQTQS